INLEQRVSGRMVLLDISATGEQLARDVQSAWLAMHTGASQITALQAALAASELRQDATHTGYEAGERTLLDVLRARNDTAATWLQLSQARVSTLLARLQLAQSAGQLDENVLREAGEAFSTQPAAQP
ncbi:MAG: TolC family protein, partial [Comamonas sp.]